MNMNLLLVSALIAMVNAHSSIVDPDSTAIIAGPEGVVIKNGETVVAGDQEFTTTRTISSAGSASNVFSLGAIAAAIAVFAL